jgi:acyl-CoA synthetase (AMP-forming)/AMP-acid ligase II
MIANPVEAESIVEIVAAHARCDPAALAYTFLASGEQEDARLTRGDLDRRSRALAAAIAGRVVQGSRVLLLFPPGLEFVEGFFGCLGAGAIAVPAYPPLTRAADGRSGRPDRAVARLRGMIADAGVSLVVAPASLVARRSALEESVPELRGLGWLATDEVRAPDKGWDWPRIMRNDVALLQYTSGSTASPRGVMVTHGNLLDNLRAGARVGAFDADSVGVSWLPVNHDMGLIGGVLQPAFSGFPVWLMAPVAFLQRPLRWLQAISRLGATHSAAPDFAYDLCARRVTNADRQALDLSTWRVAYNGSEPVRRRTLEHFQCTFGECGFRWESFRPAYGLAESTLLVAAPCPESAPVVVDVDRAAVRRGRVAQAMSAANRLTVVSCGSVSIDSRIAIVDPVQRTRCAGDEIGEIWVAGGSVAAGYWQRPEETAATFGAFVANTHEGPFLRTGDLGFLRDGNLFVTGRLKDVLIVRGLKHHPPDLELTAEQANPAIRPGCCAAFGLDATGDERVAMIAEVDVQANIAPNQRRIGEVIADIRREIAEVHQLQLSLVAVVPSGSLPRTTSGKLQRFLCRHAVMNGTLDVLGRWAADDTDAALERAS